MTRIDSIRADSKDPIVDRRSARNFELSYPVVGSIRLTVKAAPLIQFSLADTYFDPLLEGALAELWADPIQHPLSIPRLITLWQERRGTFDVEGGPSEFDPADGLVPLLERIGPRLPVIPLDLLKPAAGGTPAALDEVRLALSDFLGFAIRSSSAVIIEDLP